MFAKQGISGAKIGRHFLHGLFSSDTKSIFDTINRDAIPLFRLFSQIAIAPKIRQCRYTARSIKRNPGPSSRQDYCKPVALYPIP